MPSLCHTCSNDLLDLHVRGIDLPCEFSDGLAGVLVGGGVDVVLHPEPCRHTGSITRRCAGGRPTHPRHALSLPKTVPRSCPQPWGAQPCLVPSRPPSHPIPSQPHPHLGCCTAAAAPCSQFHAASWGTNQSPAITLPLPFPPQSAHEGQGPARDQWLKGAGPQGGGWVVAEDTRGRFCREPRGHQGLGPSFGEYSAGPWRGETHLWKTRASTVMAASRRKTSAPRMDPTTKDSLSGSWADSSPGEPATQSHRCERSHTPPREHPLPHTAPKVGGQPLSRPGGFGVKVQGLDGSWTPPHYALGRPRPVQTSSHLEAASGSRPCPRTGRGLRPSVPAPGSHRCGQGSAGSRWPCWSRWSG